MQIRLLLELIKEKKEKRVQETIKFIDIDI